MNSSVIVVDGPEWDLVNCEAFETLLRPAHESAMPVIDLSQVTYLDSACLAKIAQMQRARSAQSLIPASFVIASPALRRLFSIVGYDRRWPVFDNLDAAVAANSGTMEAGEA